ncbi:MAG: hypothetical protein WC601_06705 [Desulfotomaculaceae bacterium]
MIPLNQTIKIKKASSVDEWGQTIPGQAITYKCRLDQNSELVRDGDGKEVVSKAQILLKGLVKVAYTDTVEFTDEAGNIYAHPPLTISVIRDFTGKPLFTKVVV